MNTDNLKKYISIFIPFVGLIAGVLYFWGSIFSNAGMAVYSEPDFNIPPFAAVEWGQPLTFYIGRYTYWPQSKVVGSGLAF